MNPFAGVKGLKVTRDAHLNRVAMAKSSETQRILDLPVRDYMSMPDLTQSLWRPGINPSTFREGDITHLKPIQSAALHAIREMDGGFFPIGVGHGKTVIGILAGTVMKNVRWVFYMGPSGGGALVSQIRSQVFKMRKIWKVIPSGALKVHTYSELSSAKGTDALSRWLKNKNPAHVLFVWDEAHKLKDSSRSRTKRVLRLFAEFPAVRHVFMSGTLISRSIKDGAHLSQAALGASSPLPKGAELTAWAATMDHKGMAKPAQWNIAESLLPKFGTHDPKVTSRGGRLRVAFGNRLRTAPGVVVSKAGSLDCSSYIYYITKGPKPTQRLLDMIRDVDLTGPDGEPLESDAHAAMIRKHLCSGFYYTPDWGDEGPDLPWLDAKREWFRQVRAELKDHAQAHYDSPLLIAGALDTYFKKNGHPPEGREFLWEALVEWRVQRGLKPDLPPPNLTMGVDPYLIDHLFTRLKKQKKPVIVWYFNKATARALDKRGLKVIYAGEEVPRPKNAKVAKHMALSIKAHGTGIDGLQFAYDTQIVLEPQTGADIWEQKLGRLLRQGQVADEVTTYVYKHLDPLKKCVSEAIALAKNDREKLQMPQKILYSVSADITL